MKKPCSTCATRSRTPRSTRPRWPPTRGRGSGRSTVLRACRPTAIPHCHWTIEIDEANEPVGPIALTDRIARAPDRERGERRSSTSTTRKAALRDYRGDFEPGFRLRDLTSGTLAAVAREFQVQTHLLAASNDAAIAARSDATGRCERRWTRAGSPARGSSATAWHVPSTSPPTRRASQPHWRSRRRSRPASTDDVDVDGNRVDAHPDAGRGRRCSTPTTRACAARSPAARPVASRARSARSAWT